MSRTHAFPHLQKEQVTQVSVFASAARVSVACVGLEPPTCKLCHQQNRTCVTDAILLFPCVGSVTYFAEFAPKASRGRSVVLLEVFYAAGGSLAAALALLVLPGLGWRVWLGLCALPSLTFLLLVPVSVVRLRQLQDMFAKNKWGGSWEI